MRLRGSGKGVDFQNGDRDSVRGVDSVLVDIYFSVLGEFHGGEYWICIYIGLDWWLSICDWDVEMFFSNLFLKNDSRFFKYYLKLGVIYMFDNLVLFLFSFVGNNLFIIIYLSSRFLKLVNIISKLMICSRNLKEEF